MAQLSHPPLLTSRKRCSFSPRLQSLLLGTNFHFFHMFLNSLLPLSLLLLQRNFLRLKAKLKQINHLKNSVYITPFMVSACLFLTVQHSFYMKPLPYSLVHCNGFTLHHSLKWLLQSGGQRCPKDKVQLPHSLKLYVPAAMALISRMGNVVLPVCSPPTTF